jgi:hypothetical protein
MTSPMGDLPDWQTLVTPNVVQGNVIDQGANLTSALFSSGAPFRVWSLWVRISISTNSTYAGGQAEMRAQAQDGGGNVLLETAVIMSAANQTANQALALSLPGFTPINFGGTYSIVLVTSVGLTNLTFRASCGMFYSIP